MGKPVAEYKDYVSENEMFDFPVMFFFESATPPYKGKVLLYKLGVREFYNLTTPGINYFRVNVEGELGILVNGISFVRLDFDDGIMKGIFVMTGPLIDGLGNEFEARQK